MAYSITYPQGRAEKKPILSPVSHYLIFAVLLVAIIFLLQFVWKEYPALLHPLTDHRTQVAWSEMRDRIGQGSSVPQAVEAFCRQILNIGPVY